MLGRMGSIDVFGFPDFQQDFARQYATVIDVANRLIALEDELFQKPVSEPLHELIRCIVRTVANSFRALLILVSNGCGTDALKVARGMFESAITVLYLKKHPEMLNDYLNFGSVKRHRHYECLKQFQPDGLKWIKPDVIAESEAEYAKVESQVATKRWLKNDWCKANLREMAEEVGHEKTYVFVYPLLSSVHHLDIVGLGAQTDDEDVEILPSWNNIELALALAGMFVFLALGFYNEVASLGADKEIAALFAAHKSALDTSNSKD
jgi:hypothetical protein